MATRYRILIADDSLVVRKLLRDLLSTDYEVVGEAANGREAVTLAEELLPDLVIMDVTMPELNGIQATRQILARLPGADVVILSAKTDHESVRDGLEAGARDYLGKPPKPGEIQAVVQRVLDQRAARRKERTHQTSEDLPGRGIWSFVGDVGAAGRTTFMLSLANELQTLGGSVVVVEGDLAFGDVGFFLDLAPAGGTVADAMDPFEDITNPFMEKCVRVHESGLHVLAMPALAEPVVDRPPERLVELLTFLRRTYDYVLVDLPAGLPERYLAVLDESHYILPVGRGLPERLKNFRNLVRVLEFCGYDEQILCPVLCLTLEENVSKVVERFQLEVHAFLPRDKSAVEKAARSGMPVSRVAPRSPYTQKVRNFLGRLLDLPGASEPRRRNTGFLARLGGLITSPKAS
jgi:two-component system chemotaxis response regulator CheY